MATLDDLRGQLLALVPPPARALSESSPAIPFELGKLLSAASKSGCSLLAFAPPLAVLTAASAGLLRAAREQEASVILRVDLAQTEGRGHRAVIEGIGRACEAARYGWPLGLVAEVPINGARMASGEAGRDLSEALAAGFPALVLQVALPVDVDGLVELLSPCRELELGFGVAVTGNEPEGFLTDLRDAGTPLVAVLGDGELALAGEAFRWARAEPILRDALLEEHPPVLEVELGLSGDARGERAEALAYFAAEMRLREWKAEKSGPKIAAAAVERVVRT